MPVAGRGAPGVPHARRPRVPLVRRHLDPVADDRAAAAIQWGAPVQLDHRGAVGVRREAARRTRRLALFGVVLHRQIEGRREIAGFVPECPCARVVVGQFDVVAGADRAGQRQDHLRPIDLDTRHAFIVAVTVPGDVHVEVAARRDGVFVEVFVEGDGEFPAVHLGIDGFGVLGVRAEFVRLHEVPLVGVVVCRVCRDLDDHRAFIVGPRIHRDVVAPFRAAHAFHAVGVQFRAKDVDVRVREAGHVLREPDVEPEFFLRVPNPSMPHRDPGTDGRAGRGRPRDRPDGSVRTAERRLLGTHAHGWRQDRAAHRGGEKEPDGYHELVRNHLAASSRDGIIICLSALRDASRDAWSFFEQEARPRPANRAGASVTAAGN